MKVKKGMMVEEKEVRERAGEGREGGGGENYIR